VYHFCSQSDTFYSTHFLTGLGNLFAIKGRVSCRWRAANNT